MHDDLEEFHAGPQGSTPIGFHTKLVLLDDLGLDACRCLSGMPQYVSLNPMDFC